jgi:hypothetical protein
MSIRLFDINVCAACVPLSGRPMVAVDPRLYLAPTDRRPDADDSGVVAAARSDAARNLVCSSPTRLVWRAFRLACLAQAPVGPESGIQPRDRRGAIRHAPDADITGADREAGRSRPGRDPLEPPLLLPTARPARRHVCRAPCRQCLPSHLLRVRRSIVVGEPLHFVLPGFPAKSPSPRRSWARDLTWPRSRPCSICSGSVTSQRLSLPARRADHHLLRPRDRGRAWPR